ncbi:hypothetical protein FRB94_013485 [Tulasnella sp. JGI-2019a]|nr:hypothetical protein FRB94_013485 [Tulasnella sp. JGI-2019a]
MAPKRASSKESNVNEAPLIKRSRAQFDSGGSHESGGAPSERSSKTWHSPKEKVPQRKASITSQKVNGDEDRENDDVEEVPMEEDEPVASLQNGLLTRFKQNGDRNDLDQSINYYRDALDLRPEGHPDQNQIHCARVQ